MIAIIPFAKQMGLFLLAIVLGFAAVSYVAALRAARARDAHEAAPGSSRPHDLQHTRSGLRQGEAPVPQAGQAGARPAAHGTLSGY